MVTVWVQIFTGYKILQYLQIVLHPRNLILGYIFARDLKYLSVRIYEISCLSKGDDNVDRILGGPVSDELVAMMGRPS